MAIKENLDKIKNSVQDKIDKIKLDFAIRMSASGGTSFSKKDEKHFMQLLDLYLSGKMRPDELMTFITLAKKYFYHTKKIDPSTALPKTIISKDKDESVRGYYNRSDNIFGITENTFNECVESIQGSDKSILIEMVNTVGHELTHFNQYLTSEAFERLPLEQQHDFDKKTYKVIKDITATELKLETKELLEMDSFMGKYTDSLKSRGLTDETFELLRHTRYLKYSYEKDARGGGIDFLKSFVSLIEKSEFASDKVKTWSTENYKTIEEFEQKETDNEKEIGLELYYNSTGKQILEQIVKDNENKRLEISQNLIYERCVTEIVEQFSYQEKEQFLKKAIAENWPQFANILIKSIKRDPEYLENNKNLQEMLTTSLAKGSFDMGEEKPPLEIKFDNYNRNPIDFSLILTEDNLCECVMNCFSNNNYSGAITISPMIKNKHFLPENIIEHAKAIENSALIIFEKHRALQSLLINLSFEDILKLFDLASRNNLTMLKEFTSTQLHQFPEYHLNRAKYLKEYESDETQFSTQEEIILTGCAEYYEGFYGNQYSKKSQQELIVLQKIRKYFKVAYKEEMKKSETDLESQMAEDTSIQDFLNGDLYMGNDVAKKIVDNKPAYMMLLKTLAEETMTLNGKKVKLNDDNKRNLAALLVSVLHLKACKKELEQNEKTEQQLLERE